MNMLNLIGQILIILLVYGAVPAWALNQMESPITAAKVFVQTEIKTTAGKDGLEKVFLSGPFTHLAHEKHSSYWMYAKGSFQECYDSSFSDITMHANVHYHEEWRFFEKAEIEGKDYAILPDKLSSSKFEWVVINFSVEDLKHLAEKKLFDIMVSGKWGTKNITIHGAYIEGFLKTIDQCAVLYKHRPKE